MSKGILFCFAAVLLTAAPSFAQYTTIDYPGAIYTVVNGGPSPEGDAGRDDPHELRTHGFIMSGGAFTSIDYPGSTNTQVNGWVSPKGVVVGQDFLGGRCHGFSLYKGVFTTVDYPNSTYTVLSGINPGGDIIGSYFVPATCGAFVRDKKGTFTPITIPNGVINSGATINPSGDTVTFCTVNNVSSLCLIKNGDLTVFDVPGARSTSPGAGNPENDVVGGFTDQQFRTHGFVYSHSQNTYTQLDVPGAQYTYAAGISPQGTLSAHTSTLEAGGTGSSHVRRHSRWRKDRQPKVDPSSRREASCLG